MMDTAITMDEQLKAHDVQINGENSRTLRQNIIDHIIMKAVDSDFKCQQKNDSELSADEKRKIIENILSNSHLKFLYLFGKYLIEDHLEYFKTENINNFEINFHLHRLSRLINSKKVISKNRRYQAMLELHKGDYFDDNEMRNREPLLWEQLVGQYLSEEEKLVYDNEYVTQNSLTEVLFEQIDRDNRDELKRKQQIDEAHQPDKYKDDDDYNDKLDELSIPVQTDKSSMLWGEYRKPNHQTVKIGKHRWKKDHFPNLVEQCNGKKLSEEEKLLLINEFKSHMIHKFLNGEDDFDYNNVDNNPEYDNLHIKSIDEEERYFDSESPVEEEIPMEESGIEKESLEENDNEEDELDAYMNMLKKNEITDNVADKLKKL